MMQTSELGHEKHVMHVRLNLPAKQHFLLIWHESCLENLLLSQDLLPLTPFSAELTVLFGCSFWLCDLDCSFLPFFLASSPSYLSSTLLLIKVLSSS